jgi:hypothetical protein
MPKESKKASRRAGYDSRKGQQQQPPQRRRRPYGDQRDQQGGAVVSYREQHDGPNQAWPGSEPRYHMETPTFKVRAYDLDGIAVDTFFPAMGTLRVTEVQVDSRGTFTTQGHQLFTHYLGYSDTEEGVGQVGIITTNDNCCWEHATHSGCPRNASRCDKLHAPLGMLISAPTPQHLVLGRLGDHDRRAGCLRNLLEWTSTQQDEIDARNHMDLAEREREMAARDRRNASHAAQAHAAAELDRRDKEHNQARMQQEEAKRQAGGHSRVPQLGNQLGVWNPELGKLVEEKQEPPEEERPATPTTPMEYDEEFAPPSPTISIPDEEPKSAAEQQAYENREACRMVLEGYIQRMRNFYAGKKAANIDKLMLEGIHNLAKQILPKGMASVIAADVGMYSAIMFQFLHPNEEESEPEAEEEEVIVKAEYEPVDEAEEKEVIVMVEDEPAAPASEALLWFELSMLKQQLKQAVGHGNGEPGGDIPEAIGDNPDGAAPTAEIDNHDQGGTPPGEPDNVSEKDAIGDQGSTNMDETAAEEPDSVSKEEVEVELACDKQD